MVFFRVKRRLNEDPFNSIVVSHKKLKTIGIDSSKDCVFKFAATVKNENENLSQILKEVQDRKSVKDLTKTNTNRNTNNVVEHSKSERLKLVNTLRAVKQNAVPIGEKNEDNSNIKVVDFVKEAEDISTPILDEGISIDFVYDLFYTSNELIDVPDIDSVHGLDFDITNSVCNYNKNMDLSDDSSACEDEDNSNDEGNWRNDYPDEDEMENSDDCEDLVAESKRWNINSNSSSDVGDDDNSDGEDNIDNYDACFARYKECVKAEEHYFYNSVLDESSKESSDSDDLII